MYLFLYYIVRVLSSNIEINTTFHLYRYKFKHKKRNRVNSILFDYLYLHVHFICLMYLFLWYIVRVLSSIIEIITTFHIYRYKFKHKKRNRANSIPINYLRRFEDIFSLNLLMIVQGYLVLHVFDILLF